GGGGFDMGLFARRAFVGHPLPEDFAGAFVQRVNHPPLRGAILRGVAVAIQPRLEAGFGVAADRAGDEDALSPDDGAGMRKSWNRRAPQNIFARLAVPPVRQVLPLGDAFGLSPAKRRPVPFRRIRLGAFGRTRAIGIGCDSDAAWGDDFGLFGRRPDAVV